MLALAEGKATVPERGLSPLYNTQVKNARSNTSIPLYGCGPGLRSRYSDSLRVGWSGYQIPVGDRFSPPVQTIPEVKRPGRGINPPHTSSVEVTERGELYLYSLSEMLSYAFKALLTGMMCKYVCDFATLTCGGL